jgi:hypothetical protein
LERNTTFGEWQLTPVSLVHDVRAQLVANKRKLRLESTLAKYLPSAEIELDPVLLNPSSLFKTFTTAGSGYEKTPV